MSHLRTDASPRRPRRKASASGAITNRKIAVAPASMTDQIVSIASAADPAGSSVDSGPEQPAETIGAPSVNPRELDDRETGGADQPRA